MRLYNYSIIEMYYMFISLSVCVIRNLLCKQNSECLYIPCRMVIPGFLQGICVFPELKGNRFSRAPRFFIERSCIKRCGLTPSLQTSMNRGKFAQSIHHIFPSNHIQIMVDTISTNIKCTTTHINPHEKPSLPSKTLTLLWKP